MRIQRESFRDSEALHYLRCSTHGCDFYKGYGATQWICSLGGESVYIEKDGIKDKPYEPPPPKDPKPDRKREAQVLQEERDKEQSLLPGSFPRWFQGPRFEIDEHGHKKPLEKSSTVFVLPSSSRDIPHQDIDQEWEEAHDDREKPKFKFLVRSSWRCEDCRRGIKTNPQDCQNRKHIEAHQKAHPNATTSKTG